MQESVPARYYGQLSGVLVENGIDPHPFLESIGIPTARLTAPEGLLTAEDLERLVAGVIAYGNRPDIPLQLGRRIRLRNHSLVGFAVVSSPSVDYALRLVMRFFRLIFPAFRMRYERGDDISSISYTPTMPMSHECLKFHIEVIAAATYTAIKELHQDELPEFDLELSIEQPANLSHYRQYMPKARLRFSALTYPGVRLLLPTSVVAGQPAMANQETLDVAERRCRLLVEKIVHSRNTGEWVRMILRESTDGLPSIEEVASTINISTRTLHRYLKREDLVYRSLCAEERERRARELLCQTSLSISRIAQELGYSDASNLTRAFKLSVGCSPSSYRASNGKQFNHRQSSQF